MSTSNTYNFSKSPLDTLLQASLQLCGIVPSEVDGWKAQAALLSLNCILNDWANRGNNLWLSQTMMLPILASQQTYELDEHVTYIKELQAVKLQAVGRGSGIGADNWVGIDFGAGALVSITYAGITFPAQQSVTLNLQYTYDMTNWKNAFSDPWQPSLKTYDQGIVSWLVPTAPCAARAWRFFEINNNTIQNSSINFANPLQSILMNALSENDYFSLNRLTTFQPSSPSSYYLDRQIKPTINLWPIPDVIAYDAFVFKALTVPQDAGQLINRGQVPQRFYRSLVYEVAADLALQFAPQYFPTLNDQANLLHDRAANEDRERVPLRITPVMGRRT